MQLGKMQRNFILQWKTVKRNLPQLTEKKIYKRKNPMLKNGSVSIILSFNLNGWRL